jgi:nucleotide-binding universal stress UspA family protein
MRLPHHDDLETRERPSRRLDRIVVGVDFSEPSLAAAQWVGRYVAPAAEILLVHVTPVALMPNVARAGSDRLLAVDGHTSDRVRSLRGALRGLASLIGGARTSVEVRVGDPATQLAAYANSVDADLVVVAGSTKYHVAPRWETATIEQVVRCIDRPLLIARNVHAAPKTVLAVVADDEDAWPVLTAAQMVATPSAARVASFRMTPKPAIGSALDAAAEVRADIIAVGSHAPAWETVRDDSDVAAQMLVRTARCSVLVVPDFTRVHLPPPDAGVRRARAPSGLTTTIEHGTHLRVAQRTRLRSR